MPHLSAQQQWPQVDHGRVSRRLLGMDRAGGGLRSGYELLTRGPIAAVFVRRGLWWLGLLILVTGRARLIYLIYLILSVLSYLICSTPERKRGGQKCATPT